MPRQAGSRLSSQTLARTKVNSDELYTSLGMVVFGIALALIGHHLRKEYRRLFVAPGRIVDPKGPLAPLAAYLGYIASFMFTAAALFVVIGVATFGNELARYWGLEQAKVTKHAG